MPLYTEEEAIRALKFFSPVKFCALQAGQGHVPLRAQVVQIENLTSHANYEEMLTWLSHFDATARVTFLTHGEPVAANALEQRINQSLGWMLMIPAHGDKVRLW